MLCSHCFAVPSQGNFVDMVTAIQQLLAVRVPKQSLDDTFLWIGEWANTGLTGVSGQGHRGGSGQGKGNRRERQGPG